MTILDSLVNFKRCAEEAPAGAFEDAKALNSAIGEVCDTLITDIRALGLKADNSGGIFAIEAGIYDYVKKSNPDSQLFAVAEGFGAAMAGPARERVLEQAERDVAFIRDRMDSMA